MKQTLPILLGLLLLLIPESASSQARILKDINQLNGGGYGTNASEVVEIGDHAYFTAYSFEHGEEVFKTDGTQAGTAVLLDIVPGKESSSPRHLTRHKGFLYFTAETSENGRELWMSDGTAAGTRLVKDIVVGSGSSSLGGLVSAGDYLYFACDDKVKGSMVWRTDGTEAGTIMISNQATLEGNSSRSPNRLTRVNDNLVYSTLDGIVSTDGTQAGTKIILQAGYSGSTNNIYSANNKLYIDGWYRGSSAYLWESDGTIEGTRPLPIFKSRTFGLAALGNLLVYVHNDGESNYEVWRTDGTEEGTYMLRDINPGPGSSAPLSLQNINDVVYFVARESAGIMHKLWRTDGYTQGTYKVCEAPISINSHYNPVPTEMLTHSNGKIYFKSSRYDGTYSSIWVTDGTEHGSYELEAHKGTSIVTLRNFSPSKHGIYFNQWGQLWKTDGTENGTDLVANLTDGTSGSIPNYNKTLELNGIAYFTANDGVTGEELWRSDGTEAGTRLIRDLNPGAANSSPRNLTKIGNNLYFTATDGRSENSLWRVSNSSVNSLLIAGQSTVFKSITNLTPRGNTLFFVARHDISGTELWSVENNSNTARLLKDINTGRSDSNPGKLTVVGNTLYFTATTAVDGTELWKSDGTNAGTVLVKDINPSTASSNPANLTAVGNSLFFITNSQLWRTNGTEAGTTMIKAIPGLTQADANKPLRVIGDIVFFTVRESLSPFTSLWRSDGTSDGTYEITFDKERSFYVENNCIETVNDEIFFVASSFQHNVSYKQLWKSDGTSAGTKLVKNLYITAGVTFESALGVVGGSLFFTTRQALNPESKYKIWKSNGTAAGTYEVYDFHYAPNAPGNGVAINNSLLFSAADREKGNEIWIYQNTLPTSEDKTISVSSASAYQFHQGDFPFSDADKHDLLYSVSLRSLPQKGTLQFNGKAVSINQAIKAKDLVNLAFIPDTELEETGTPYASFKYQVNDAMANSIATYTLTIQIQQAPSSADATVRTSAVDAYTFSKDKFLFESTLENDDLTYLKVVQLPVNGKLYLHNELLIPGTEIPAIELEQLTFRPDKAGITASFLYKVKGHTTYSNGNYRYTLQTNNLPVSNTKEIVVDANTAYTFKAEQFGFTDEDSEDALTGIHIKSLPSAGILSLHGNPVTLDQQISAEDLSNLVYTLNKSTADTSSFHFKVSDGIDYSMNHYKITINHNIATPSSANKSARVSGINAYQFSVDDFGFRSPIEYDQLTYIEVVEVPNAGRLLLENQPLSAESEIPAAKLTQLIFQPDATGITTGFQFRVKGISSYSGYTYRYELLTNNIPTSSDKEIMLKDESSYTFKMDDFNFVDEDKEDVLLGIQIKSLPSSGSLFLRGSPVQIGQLISAGEISSLLYTTGTLGTGGSESFEFRVYDGIDYSLNNYKATIKHAIITSIQEEFDDASLSIYPNPSQGIFYVSTPDQASIKSLKVYDILGRELLYLENCDAYEKRIDLQRASKGTYFIDVWMSNGKFARRKLLIHY